MDVWAWIYIARWDKQKWVLFGCRGMTHGTWHMGGCFCLFFLTRRIVRQFTIGGRRSQSDLVVLAAFSLFFKVFFLVLIQLNRFQTPVFALSATALELASLFRCLGTLTRASNGEFKTSAFAHFRKFNDFE